MARKTQRFDDRQSMKNKQFEIFHYRDKKPENVGIHHHDFYEVYFFLGGNARFSVEGQNYILEKGDLLLINPLELHQVRIEQDTLYDRMVLWINCSYLDALGGTAENLAECFDRSTPYHRNFIRPDPFQRAALQALLEKMDTEFYGDHMGSTLYAQALLVQFMLEVKRLACHASEQSGAEEPDLVTQLLNYIGHHFQENITLERLASEFYVSKSYLSHEFQRRVGTSVYQYVIFRRLMQARELMSEGQSPGSVYQVCGFGDYANFYRAFKAEYGISPREFMPEQK